MKENRRGISLDLDFVIDERVWINRSWNFGLGLLNSFAHYNIINICTQFKAT